MGRKNSKPNLVTTSVSCILMICLQKKFSKYKSTSILSIKWINVHYTCGSHTYFVHYTKKLP